jgi:hypothetical protein
VWEDQEVDERSVFKPPNMGTSLEHSILELDEEDGEDKVKR